MTQDDSGETASRRVELPEPPYPAELLADLHADALPADVAAHIRSRIVDDAAAQEILASLDQTVALLRNAPLEAVDAPPAVRAATDRTLADVRSAAPQPSPARSRAKFGTGARVALTAAAVVVIAAIGISLWQAARPDDQPASVATHQPVGLLNASDAAVAFSFIGHTAGPPFASAEDVRRCTAANGVAAAVGVVGYGQAQINRKPTVLIVLGTGMAGRFDVLMVAPGCTTDRPATIGWRRIGG